MRHTFSCILAPRTYLTFFTLHPNPGDVAINDGVIHLAPYRRDNPSISCRDYDVFLFVTQHVGLLQSFGFREQRGTLFLVSLRHDPVIHANIFVCPITADFTPSPTRNVSSGNPSGEFAFLNFSSSVNKYYIAKPFSFGIPKKDHVSIRAKIHTYLDVSLRATDRIRNKCQKERGKK